MIRTFYFSITCPTLKHFILIKDWPDLVQRRNSLESPQKNTIFWGTKALKNISIYQLLSRMLAVTRTIFLTQGGEIFVVKEKAYFSTTKFDIFEWSLITLNLSLKIPLSTICALTYNHQNVTADRNIHTWLNQGWHVSIFIMSLCNLLPNKQPNGWLNLKLVSHYCRLPLLKGPFKTL